MRLGTAWVTRTLLDVIVGGSPEVVPPGHVVLVVETGGLWARVLLEDGRTAWVDGAWWSSLTPLRLIVSGSIFSRDAYI